MIQGAGRARLVLEAPEPFGILREVQRQHLDGYVAHQPRIVRAVYLAHAATADALYDLEGAQLVTRLQRGLVRRGGRRMLQERFIGSGGAEQRLNLGAQLLICSTGVVEEGGPLAGGLRLHGFEQLIDLLPQFRFHHERSFSNSRLSQAFARPQS